MGMDDSNAIEEAGYTAPVVATPVWSGRMNAGGTGAPPPDKIPPVQSDDARAADAGLDPLIVVVDDDASIVEGLGMLLEGWGFQVLSALTLDDLSRRLPAESRLPVLVIADHFLPGGGTGLQVVELVRAHAGSQTPAIILTGDSTPDRRAEAQALNCELLLKPVQVGPLKETVDALVSR